MIHVPSVETTSRAVEGTAASAESDYAAQRAAQLLWERTTATTADTPSIPNTRLRASRVCTHSVYVQLYT